MILIGQLDSQRSLCTFRIGSTAARSCVFLNLARSAHKGHISWRSEASKRACRFTKRRWCGKTEDIHVHHHYENRSARKEALSLPLPLPLPFERTQPSSQCQSERQARPSSILVLSETYYSFLRIQSIV